MRMGMMSPSWAFFLLFLLHCSVAESSSAAAPTPDLKNLTLSALDLLSTYANQTLVHSGDLFKNSPDPVMYRIYGTCIDAYQAALRQVTEAISALNSGDYATSREVAGYVALDADRCGQQWADEWSPLTTDNKMVRGLSVLASSMVGLLG